jgi:YVTN family beta-propeller protein
MMSSAVRHRPPRSAAGLPGRSRVTGLRGRWALVAAAVTALVLPLAGSGLATAGAAGAAPAVIATIPVGQGAEEVAVNPLTNTIYVTNGHSNTVSVIDGQTNAVTATIAVPGPYPADPEGVAVDPTTDTIYVANQYSDTVSVIDGQTNAVTANISVGHCSAPGYCTSYPLGVAVDPTTDTVYVTDHLSNKVQAINGLTNTVSFTLGVGIGPWGVADDSANHTFWVANLDSATVTAAKPGGGGFFNTIGVGTSPIGVAVDPTTDRIYVANSSSNTVSEIDGHTQKVAATITVATPLQVAADETTDTLYVTTGAGTVSVIDGRGHKVTGTVAVGSNLAGVAVDSFTHTVYVANNGSNTVSVIAG